MGGTCSLHMGDKLIYVTGKSEGKKRLCGPRLGRRTKGKSTSQKYCVDCIQSGSGHDMIRALLNIGN
jgi:hypothetical protein